MYRPVSRSASGERGKVWLLLNTSTGQMVGTVEAPMVFPTKGDATRYAAQLEQAAERARRREQAVDQEPGVAAPAAISKPEPRQRVAIPRARPRRAAKAQPKGTSGRGKIRQKRSAKSRGG